ncbi:MAG: hypothetical protein ACOCP8_05885, partial [archaeon]
EELLKLEEKIVENVLNNQKDVGLNHNGIFDAIDFLKYLSNTNLVSEEINKQAAKTLIPVENTVIYTGISNQGIGHEDKNFNGLNGIGINFYNSYSNMYDYKYTNFHLNTSWKDVLDRLLCRDTAMQEGDN